MSGDSCDERERVRRAAAALSPLERDVLALSAGLGLSIDEVAARLAISERRVERLLARAIVGLARTLGGAPR